MQKLHWRCEALQAAERQAEEAAKRVERITEEGVERAQRMVDKVEKIGKGVEDRAEKFFGSMPRPEFHYDHDTQQGDQPGQAHQTRHQFGNHHHSGPAPATTIYHHYHHGQSAATETSTTTFTSTTVTTSTSTITCVTLTATTTIATATTTAFFDAATRPKEIGLEELLEPVYSPIFWVLGVFLLICTIALYSLLKNENPRDQKTQPSTESEFWMSLPTQIEFDLTSLKPYITTPSRRFLAVTLCRTTAALYCLESYWIMKTMWTIFKPFLEILWEGTGLAIFVVIVLTPFHLLAWSMIGQAICIGLDFPFTFVSQLALLPVSADVSHASTSKGKKRPKNEASKRDKQACKDKQSTGSGSEEGWQTDLHG
ncbi:uncharacterized protein NECHADRAFT_88185 [Fusarium vanettenii 77-13-4]|uniref:Transmembrane protein n=1 Tax=Fusarium vanettenii (strain ATCC MYA-4622 / CBS 123669 / FGSC 9596 / NRRL 45880 / 77-13-4) TaxID=660122 RepID=C7ZDF8_FUSV7|nr:uncharacterized protein NECHADRAFT_88185 [Fusarium vanettenii 77-13-4]EEU37774.1 predicted protein [Fusarium vanettenii 77-13-4]